MRKFVFHGQSSQLDDLRFIRASHLRDMMTRVVKGILYMYIYLYSVPKLLVCRGKKIKIK